MSIKEAAQYLLDEISNMRPNEMIGAINPIVLRNLQTTIDKSSTKRKPAPSDGEERRHGQ